MNKNVVVLVAAFGWLGTFTVAAAQQAGLRQQVVGVWSLSSQYVERPDGSRVERFGANPKGLAFFDQGGRFSQVMMRPDLPKIASNNAMTATDAENRAIIEGSTAFFGTWSVDEATGTLLNRIEGATFPNWNGTELKRTLSISGDEMKQCVASQIGGTSCATWRRVR
jgi:hypothetical protein